jgi:parafibromin
MAQPDVLLALRQSLTLQREPLITSSAEVTDAAEDKFSAATHLQVKTADGKSLVYALDDATRLLSNDEPVTLRSVFFAWQHRDAPALTYVGATGTVNKELEARGSSARVRNLPFAERADLAAWLSGQQDESEYAKPLEASDQAGAALDSGAASGLRAPKAPSARVLEIYSGERSIADRNSILRGIKPTDFSHVRKHAAAILKQFKGKPGQPTAAVNNALVSNLKKPSNRRPEPIILLSPSASSLIRMSNVRKFLEEGVFVPADSLSASGTTILNIQRSMPSIDPTRPIRFVLVENSDQFKPDYWSRLVGVFTTGQTWQFKSYKWSNPQELFSKALGIHVGWSGEHLPQSVESWGRSVKNVGIDLWNPIRGEDGRWRDREVVESIWSAIEQSMRTKGWNKEPGMK